MAVAPRSSSSTQRWPKMVDKVVGSFNIDGEIGRGSFATVYRGHHKTTRALVAIKSVNLSKLNKKLKENLYTEIEILKGLHHSHIVALIDCRESATHIHLVMEYCELGDLSYFIKKREKLGDHEALREMARRYPVPAVGGLHEVIVRHFLKQLASALEFMRARNYIHRDVKPQNLLILPSPVFLANSRGRPVAMKGISTSLEPAAGLLTLPMLKIADFGFARSLPSTSLAETLCGSPLYMAPEILRYEKYDAKADLWSVGTVLYEMMTGKPPFRATNHVELLRRIEQSEDHIRFPKDVLISAGIKDLIQALLKRTPSTRMSFRNFFAHPVVVETIPGLVGDDQKMDLQVSTRSSGTLLSQTPSIKSNHQFSQNGGRFSNPSSPKDRVSPAFPGMHTAEIQKRTACNSPRAAIPARHVILDQKRPSIVSSVTTPNMKIMPLKHTRINTQEIIGDKAQQPEHADNPSLGEARAEAEQAVRDAREYVLVEKRAVEVNAFADEMAANPRLQGTKYPLASKTGIMARRATTQGVPTADIENGPVSPTRQCKISDGRLKAEAVLHRQNSYRKSYGSPSVTSAISRALNSASLRVFGVSYPDIGTKGGSPPNFYNHTYPTSTTSPSALALIGDGSTNRTLDEDYKFLIEIEEAATRSDVVFGFAEVKYKQLIPLAPSVDRGLGGLDAVSNDGLSALEDEGLTQEAVVALSEEALLLYIKALSLLAKSMDIARAWWTRKSRNYSLQSYAIIRNEPYSHTLVGTRINLAVQWVRNRFNEVFEKAELISLKLLHAQKQLPETHPAYLNHASMGSANVNCNVIFTSGITAEKLMYDRAIDMSRSAAINELANEDIDGCERSYMTAIKMLEAVLENDENSSEVAKTRFYGAKEENVEKHDDLMNGIDFADRQAVLKVISMIKVRLGNLHKKKNLIAKHSMSPRPD